jgi:hypothetical protein
MFIRLNRWCCSMAAAACSMAINVLMRYGQW